VIATPRHNSTVWNAMQQPNMEHFVVTKRPDAKPRQKREIVHLSI